MNVRRTGTKVPRKLDGIAVSPTSPAAPAPENDEADEEAADVCGAAEAEEVTLGFEEEDKFQRESAATATSGSAIFQVSAGSAAVSVRATGDPAAPKVSAAASGWTGAINSESAAVIALVAAVARVSEVRVYVER